MSKTDQGKGSDWRKDFDFSKFWTNYDSLTGQNTFHYKKKKRLKNGKTRYIYK